MSVECIIQPINYRGKMLLTILLSILFGIWNKRNERKMKENTTIKKKVLVLDQRKKRK